MEFPCVGRAHEATVPIPPHPPTLIARALHPYALLSGGNFRRVTGGDAPDETFRNEERALSTDLQNLLATAQQLVDEGRFPEAIEAYRRATEAAPRESRPWLRLGDLYLRTGDRKAARECYERVARVFVEDGIPLKAAAVYKQILKLEPDDIPAHVALADSYLKLGLVNEATSSLESAVHIATREGRREDSILPLQKLTELRPDDVRLLVRLAEALSASHRTKDAAEAFERAAALLQREGRRAEFIKVAERLLYHRPEDAETARNLAEAYLDEGDQKRALARLQLCFKADPRDTETLMLLARAFLGLGQEEKAISVYREVAAIHETSNRPEAQLAAMEEILKHSPQDELALEVVERLRPVVRAAQPTAPPAAPSAVPVPPTGDPMETARRLLDAGEFLPLIELLEPLVEVNEDHVEARKLLLTAFETLGQSDEAVDQLLALAEYYSFDDPDSAERYLRRVLELDPENIEAKLQLKGTSAGAVIASIIPPALEAKLEEEIDLDEGGALGLEVQERSEHKAHELDLRCGALAPPAVPKISIPPPLDDPEPAHHEPAFEDPRPSSAPTLEHGTFSPESLQPSPPSDPQQSPVEDAGDELIEELSLPGVTFDGTTEEIPEDGALGNIDVDIDIELLEPISPEEFEALPITEPPSPEPSSAAADDPSEIEEILEEAEFYVSQALLAEARDTLLEGLEEFPDHPLLSERLNEIQTELESAGPSAAENELTSEVAASSAHAPAQTPSHELDDTFALASKLAEQAPAQTPSSDAINAHEIFEQFKEGVAREIDEEDSATHFDLGIAYREMGLYDDAIREFELAGRAPLRTCNALTMIGLCHVDAGRYESAIEAFEQALEAPHKLEGEIVGLHYEIGLAQSLRGEKSRAVEAFEKAAAIDPSFRDVSVRLEMLRGEGP